MAIFAIMFFLFISASAAQDIEVDDLDSVIDFQEEGPVFATQKKPEIKKPQIGLAPQCTCQCLTRGKKPKSSRSWKGEFKDGKCVCVCAS